VARGQYNHQKPKKTQECEEMKGQCYEKMKRLRSHGAGAVRQQMDEHRRMQSLLGRWLGARASWWFRRAEEQCDV
jgi:hypothetical protein